MSTESEEELFDAEDANHEESGRTKQKIRIKYRQRVKIKKRPKGYKLKKYWDKNSKNIIATLILVGLLLSTGYMMVQVAKKELEMKQHEQRQRLRTK
jgi:site-specific recombinase